MKSLLDLLERFVVAHESIAASLTILAKRGSSDYPISIYDKGKREREY